MATVARNCGIERKVVEQYFQILEDLLLAVRLPVFTKRAKRAMTSHPKFFYFDVGVYRALRPSGPLDEPEVIDGVALETLVFEVKRTARLRDEDLKGLKTFQKDYPAGQGHFLYMGDQHSYFEGLQVQPVTSFLSGIENIL